MVSGRWKMSKLLIFAYNMGEKENPMLSHKGWFDGSEFIPLQGSQCHSIDDLKKYDYVQIFAVDGLKHHIPKRFNKNLSSKMRNAYVATYGDMEQMDLFGEGRG